VYEAKRQVEEYFKVVTYYHTIQSIPYVEFDTVIL
jgi:hypothetical protein